MKSIFTLLTLLLLGVVYGAPAKGGKAPAIQWGPCEIVLGDILDYLKVTPDCAKLDVPLDYTDPHCGESLSLQLIKINATKAPVKGSVIFNPGGPGASGVEDLAQSGSVYNR